MDNTIRLRRKNETVLKIMIIISVVRLILTIIDKGTLASSGWMVTQIVLCVVMGAGCVAMNMFLSDSELTRFIACGGVVLTSAISLFNILRITSNGSGICFITILLSVAAARLDKNPIPIHLG